MFRNQNNRFLYYGAENNVRLFGLITLCQCVIFCFFLGFGFGMMGIIMTSVGYSSKDFPDSPIKIIGPILLCVALLACGTAVGLLIFTIKKKRELQSQATQGQTEQITSQPYSTSSASPYPVASQCRPPDVYDPEKRKLTTDMPPSYEAPVGPAPVEPRSDMHGQLEQPSYNPCYGPPQQGYNPYSSPQ